MKTLKAQPLWRWLLMLVAAVALSATFTACGDDDDDDNGEVSGLTKKLVGLWQNQYDDYSRFNSDGTGFLNATDPSGEDGDYFTNYRVYESEDSPSGYFISFNFLNEDDEEGEDFAPIDDITSETFRINWSGWENYHRVK